MAKFAIVGLLSLAALLLSVSAQSGRDKLTLIDDSDLNAETSTSGDGNDGDDVPVDDLPDYPLISEDLNWKNQICTRYRSGTQAMFLRIVLREVCV